MAATRIDPAYSVGRVKTLFLSVERCATLMR